MITRRPLFILLTLASFLLTAKQVPAQYVIGTTGVGYDQPNNTLLSYHATDFIDYDTNYWYDPYVQGFIIDLDHDRQVLSSVQVLGGSADYFVEAGTSARTQPGQSYSIESDHYIVAYFLVQGCFSSGCGFYWYDPFGYNFASVGDVGGNFNFSPVGRISYLTFQAYYLGTTIIQVRLAGIPSISGISPSAGVLGQNVNATISGSNFGSSPTVQVSGNGVSANVTSASDTQINVSFSIAGNADLGQHSVTVGASNYTSNAVGFSVGDQTPQINGISPGSGEAGRTVGVTITGSGFGNRPTVSAGNGINVSVTSANNNQITANFTIARDTPTGGR
ncbi:MAG: IPT/TIG domain-containing protein, partial [Pyrinomonadaceae bacterium]